MRRIALILTAIAFCGCAFSVTQKGYVRTITRPNSVGQRLPGVMIRAKGKNNSVVTDNAGNFEVVFDGLNNGEPYSLMAIMKAGYELQEKEMIGRMQSCSDRVPIEILMVSREELAREKMMIEEKVREKLEAYYMQKLSALDSALQNHLLVEGEYQRQMEELNEMYGRYEPLLNAMADKYARTDYAGLDSLSYKINQAIEKGDIQEAERLLMQKGNMAERESHIKSKREAEERAGQMLDSMRAETMKGLRELADDYYHMYSINMTRFAHDSARYYILRRAELDTTNVEYQLQAAQYLLVFTMEYDLAIKYDERALRHSISRNGRMYGDVATAYNDIAMALKNMHRLDDSEHYMNMALEIREGLNGKRDKSVAESYNNIGSIYFERGDYGKAQEYFQKSIKIREELTGRENEYEKAKSELNLASAYVKQEKHKKAIELIEKVLPVLTQRDGENSTEVAGCYNSLGAAYYYMKDYESSAQYFEKAYMILKQIKGENHEHTKQVEGNLKAVKSKLAI